MLGPFFSIAFVAAAFAGFAALVQSLNPLA